MEISVKDRKLFYPELKKMGFCGLDVPFATYTNRDRILTPEYTSRVLQKYETILAAGLRVCQTHLTYYPAGAQLPGDGTYEAFEAYMLPLLIKEIELTARMDCKVSVLHLYFEDDREVSRQSNIRLLSQLLPVAEKHNVVLAIENIYAKGYTDAHLSTKDDLLFYVNYFNSAHLGICLDTGHAIILKQDPVALFRALKEHIVALHLHTTVETIDLHAIPYDIFYGEKIDWVALCKEILASPYAGTFNMELFPSHKISEAAQKAFYRFAYETAKSILADAAQ